MKHIILILSLSGLALCGSLSNEYLPPNSASGQFSRTFGQYSGGVSSSYSPTSRFGSSGSTFGTNSFRPSTQYGVPSTSSLNRQFGGSYSPVSQYSRPAAPAPVYGAPSQISGASNFGRSSSFSRPTGSFSSGSHFRTQTAPTTQYGAPSFSGYQQGYGGTSYPSQFGGQSRGISTQYGAPSTQYGAPSVSGYQQGFGGSSYPSQFGAQSRGVSTQYGAPSPVSFRSGPHFGGLSFQGGVSSGYRPATAYQGTIQDSNGGYVY